MIYIDLTLEDVRFVAKRKALPSEDGLEVPRPHVLWEGWSVDSLTGKEWHFTMTDKQIQAITMFIFEPPARDGLFVGGGEAYEIANEALKDCPVDCRPIP